MAKSKSSKQWLEEHFDDPYVKQAQLKGYRSRACFKLIELNEKDHFLMPGMLVVDLGSAPGGWSQVACEIVGHSGKVIASDILPMDPLPGVDFIQGDFTDDNVYSQICQFIGNRPVDVVISDMAPNMSGMKDIDQPKALYLVELAMQLALKVLKKDGVFLTKVFQGEGFSDLLKQLRMNFQVVASRKPASSRARSPEIYLLCKGYKKP